MRQGFPTRAVARSHSDILSRASVLPGRSTSPLIGAGSLPLWQVLWTNSRLLHSHLLHRFWSRRSLRGEVRRGTDGRLIPPPHPDGSGPAACRSDARTFAGRGAARTAGVGIAAPGLSSRVQCAGSAPACAALWRLIGHTTAPDAGVPATSQTITRPS